MTAISTTARRIHIHSSTTTTAHYLTQTSPMVATGSSRAQSPETVRRGMSTAISTPIVVRSVRRLEHMEMSTATTTAAHVATQTTKETPQIRIATTTPIAALRHTLTAAIQTPTATTTRIRCT
jgi:hypothetical protein